MRGEQRVAKQPWRRSPILALTCLALLLLSPACGGGGGGGGGSGNQDSGTVTGGVDTHDFLLSPGISKAQLYPGAQVQSTLRLLRGADIDGAVALRVVGTGNGIHLDFAQPSLLDSETAFTVRVDDGVAQGSYPMTLVGEAEGVLRTARFDVIVMGSTNFNLRTTGYAAIRQNGSVELPVAIQHGYGSTAAVTLSAISLPAGLSVDLPDDPVESAITTVTFHASAALTPGIYHVHLQGEISGQTTVSRLLLDVADGSEAGDVFIAHLDLGQTVFEEDLTLVGSKSTVLRVFAQADRSGILSPQVRVTASAEGEVLGTMLCSGPAQVPTDVNLTSLYDCYRATLPSAWIRTGLRLRVEIDPLASLTERDKVHNQREWDCSVNAGPVLRLTLVPLTIGTKTATVMDFKPTILAMLPLRDVQISVRAAYVPSSVSGSTIESGEWYSMLSEIVSLRNADGATDYYYALVPTSANASGIGGLGYLNFPVAAGLDGFSSVLVHELGHNFNLNHAPCGVSGDPNFPYAGAKIGTLGYSSVSNSVVPTSYADVMSYCFPVWLSDYNYEWIQSYLETHTTGLAANMSQDDPGDMLLISGRITDGTVRLDPVQQVRAPLRIDHEGPYTLRLRTPDGDLSFPLKPSGLGTCVPDAAGREAFSLVVPDPGNLSAIEIERDGLVVASLQAAFAAGMADDDQPVSTHPELDATEKDGRLVLSWNHLAFPHLMVQHVGEATTTLALRLSGGKAEIPLVGVPEGGRFVFRFAQGLGGRMQEMTR